MAQSVVTTVLFFFRKFTISPRKLLPFTRFVICMFISVVCIELTQKQRGKKTKLIKISHRNSKNGHPKHIFFAQPLKKITEIVCFLEPSTSFLHLSTGILDPSSFSNCSSCLIFEGCLLQTAILRPLHSSSVGFRSRLIAGHFRTLQWFVFIQFCQATQWQRQQNKPNPNVFEPPPYLTAGILFFSL